MSQSSPNAMSQAERIARVAELNDALRRSIHSPGRNQIVMTAGVAALIGEVALFRGFRRRAEIIRIVRDYDPALPEHAAAYARHPVPPSLSARRSGR